MFFETFMFSLIRFYFLSFHSIHMGSFVNLNHLNRIRQKRSPPVYSDRLPLSLHLAEFLTPSLPHSGHSGIPLFSKGI